MRDDEFPSRFPRVCLLSVFSASTACGVCGLTCYLYIACMPLKVDFCAFSGGESAFPRTKPSKKCVKGGKPLQGLRLVLQLGTDPGKHISPWHIVRIWRIPRGIPKSSILIGFSIRNHPFWGPPILGNLHKYIYIYTHIYIYIYIYVR